MNEGLRQRGLVIHQGLRESLHRTGNSWVPIWHPDSTIPLLLQGDIYGNMYLQRVICKITQWRNSLDLYFFLWAVEIHWHSQSWCAQGRDTEACTGLKCNTWGSGIDLKNWKGRWNFSETPRWKPDAIWRGWEECQNKWVTRRNQLFYVNKTV